MKVEHHEKNGIGAFYIAKEGEWVAELDYEVTAPDVITIYHTEVLHALEGKHVGSQLVKACVEYARDEGIKIIPVCSFAKYLIDKTKAFQDVVAC